jgi:hypothetical protein
MKEKSIHEGGRPEELIMLLVLSVKRAKVWDGKQTKKKFSLFMLCLVVLIKDSFKIILLSGSR